MPGGSGPPILSALGRRPPVRPDLRDGLAGLADLQARGDQHADRTTPGPPPSSGTKQARGAITKTGNTHLRRILVEAAWHYRHRPFVGAALRRRQHGAPPTIIAQAWAAQQRLHRRYHRLAGRGKPNQQVITAVARELTGFVWAALVQ